MKMGFVYILSNYSRTTLYIGVTNDLQERVAEHRNGTGSEFTSKYKLHYLLYFEEYQSIQLAIAREKQLKRWHREWKFNLIRTVNPELKDLMEI
jgi:putative endonuclease